MIYLKLFLTFLEVGAVSFGGGYAMISLISEKVISQGWLTQGQLLNIVAVAESTPGPIAVNMATFVGATQGGALGSLLATLGVVLPSFIIILLIASLMKNLLKYKPVQAILKGIRPCVIGLILATGLTMLASTVFGIKNITTPPQVDVVGLIIFALIVAIALISKKITKKAPSPIIMILISAGLGMVLYK